MFSNFFYTYRSTLLILSWISLWSAINSYVQYINFSFLNSYNSIIATINFLRFIIPVSSIIISIFVIIKLNFKKKVQNKTKLKYSKIVTIFYIYLIIEILAFAKMNSINSDLNNLYLIILSIGGLNTLIIIVLLDETKLYNQILITSFFCLLFLLIANLIINFNKITSINYKYNFYSSFNNYSINFLGEPNQNILGFSRILSLINLCMLALYLNFKKKITLIVFFLISIIIFIFQSRGTIVCFMTSVFILWYYNKKNIRNILYILLFIFLLILSNKLFINKNTEDNNFFNSNISKNRIFITHNTSGRLLLWEESLKNYNLKNILGYGPQADRVLIDNKDITKIYGNNVSNSLIYSFLCAGYFGLAIFLILYFKIIILILNSIKNRNLIINNNSNNNLITSISLSFVSFFLIRSIVENSFAVFGVDFLLMFLCLVILEQRSNYQ